MTQNLRVAKKLAKYLRGTKKQRTPKKMLQVVTKPNKCSTPKVKTINNTKYI